MSFTGRIRLYLILIAFLPPLAIVGAVWYQSNKYTETARSSDAEHQARSFVLLSKSQSADMKRRLSEYSRAVDWSRFARPSRGMESSTLPHSAAGLDFVELTDSCGVVVWSLGRSELIGDTIPMFKPRPDTSRIYESVEYDQDGRHGALSSIQAVGRGHHLYGGIYLDRGLVPLAQALLGGIVELTFVGDSTETSALDNLVPLEVYQNGDDFQILLSGGRAAGYYLTTTLAPTSDQPGFLALYIVAILIGVFAVAIAIALGWYLSRRAEEELDNLLAATERVAHGDLQTPLFAYDVGEFSRLADGLSDMITKLRQSQERLTATERIAAWQVMGRKIAHEIKNPLTPISICTDDLRRSFAEGRADFAETLQQNTTTIKGEIQRMTRLLDQFVSFARMPAPTIVETPSKSLVADIRMLYQSDLDTGALVLTVSATRPTFRLDPEQIKQVIINLIKNSREAGDGSVTLNISDTDTGIAITVEDSGPGFSAEKLANPFEPYVSTKKDGSGLGLVICQRIAIDHGGTIEVYNKPQPERGAGVRVTLPQN